MKTHFYINFSVLHQNISKYNCFKYWIMESDKLMKKKPNLIVVFLLKSITISIHFNNYALQNKHLLHRL